jgi:putative RecB family exonuclease
MAERYSYSKLNLFERCPQQYKFNYIEKATVERHVTIELFTGDVLHRVLEKLYEARMLGKVLSKEETLALYDAEWEGAPMSSLKVSGDIMKADDFVKHGRSALENYYDTYQPFDSGKTIAVEQKVDFTIDEARGLKMTGKIDRLARREDGTVEIIDYKYTRGIPKRQELERNPQLGLYQTALYQLAAKENWPDFGDVHIRMIYLRQGEEFSAKLTPDVLDEIREQTLQRILAIRRAKRDNDFQPSPGAICAWCQYVEICPAKRHELMVTDELTADEEAKRGQEIAERYLELAQQEKIAKASKDALKEEITQLARNLKVTALSGIRGSIGITDKEEAEFPSRTKDPEADLAISSAVKETDFDLFELYANLNLKELYKAYDKEQLPDTLRAKLSQFVTSKHTVILRTKYKKPVADDD